MKQIMGTQLTAQQYNAVVSHISGFSYNTATTAHKMAYLLDLDNKLAEDTLNALTDIGILQNHPALRCPECSLLFMKLKDPNDFEPTVFCYGCEQNVEVSASNVEVVFELQRRGKGA